MNLPRTLIVLAMFAGLSQAQTFEVASIRPSGPASVRGSDGGPGSKDPTRYIFGQATLLDLVGIAYDAKSFRISSRTPLDQERFDLVAKLPEGATKPQFRTMLQNLLAERFALKSHIESRDFPAYELVVAKSGLKMKEVLPGEAQPAASTSRPTGDIGWPELPPNLPRMAAQYSTSGGYALVRLRAQLQTIAAFADFLTRRSRNQTGKSVTMPEWVSNY